MTTFTREELNDITVAIDVLIEAYSDDLETALKKQYRYGTEGGHRVRAVLSKVYAVLATTPIHENDEPA